MNGTDARCLAITQDVCGEGCIWHPELNAVFWTDINRGLLHRYLLASAAVDTWQFDQPVTAVFLSTQPHLIGLVLGGRIVLWDTQFHKEVDTLFRLPDWPRVRCNDARVDPAGVLWFGTMQNNVRADVSTADVTEWRGSLYSLVPGGSVRQWRSGFGIANTLAWSPGGDVMYFGDTLQNTLYRAPFDAVSSTMGNAEIFFSGYERGLPDGSAVDSEGCLWNCRYGGGCIVRIAPNGNIVEIAETPVCNPTTCAFGMQDMRTLFFTSAAAVQSAQQTNQDGALFSLVTPIGGLPSPPLLL